MMEPKNPHSFKVTWKKATGPVTGYRVHCFPVNSQRAEIVKHIPDGNQVSGLVSGLKHIPDGNQVSGFVSGLKHIPDGNQVSGFVSGLKPETVYRVAITSVSSGTESKLVFSKDEVKLRKSIMNELQ